MRIIPIFIILLSLVGCARSPYMPTHIDQQLYELERVMKTGSSGRDVKVSVNGNIMRANVNNNILFDFDSYRIKEQFLPTIQRLSNYLRKNQTIFLVVEGHTDHMGDSNYNQMLSFKRAQAVKKAFIYYGVDKNKINAIGLGEENPLRGASSLQNRRVEMVFIVDRKTRNRFTSDRNDSQPLRRIPY